MEKETASNGAGSAVKDLLRRKKEVIASIGKQIKAHNQNGNDREMDTADGASILAGDWRTIEHTIEGQPFLEYFRSVRLKGAVFEDAEIVTTYSFRGTVCVKALIVKGLVGSEAPAALDYRQKNFHGYSIVSPGIMAVTMEGGYVSQRFGSGPAEIRELEAGQSPVILKYTFEKGCLVLADESGREIRKMERC